jgi:2-methylcitrate dehydratase PrpD
MLTAQLAKRCASLEFADLPGEVVATAQLCVLDWLGVTLAGSHEPGPEMLLSLARPDPDGGVSVIGHPGVRLPVEDAALINGTSSHVLDFDDVQRRPPGGDGRAAAPHHGHSRRRRP